MSLHKNSIQVFFTRIFRLVVSFITSILIARWLQPDGRGAYSLITQFHLFAVAFGGMSVGHATIHYSGSGKYSNNEQVSNAVLSAIILSSITCGIIFLSKDFLNKIFPLNSTILFILLILIPISILDLYIRSILQANHKFTWINSIDILQALVLCIFIIYLCFILKPDLNTALYAWMTSLLISFCFLIRRLRAIEPIHIKFKFNIFREHILFGAKAHLSTIIGLLSLRFDQYILGYLTNKATVGRYSIAVTVAELVLFLPASVSFVLLPRVAQSAEQDSYKCVTRYCWYMFYVSLLTACFIAILAIPLINYGYGQSYHESLMALWLLLPGMVAMSVTSITTPYFLGRLGKPHLGAIVAAVALTSNIYFNFILIPIYKINGASIASTLSYTLATVVNLYLFKREYTT